MENNTNNNIENINPSNLKSAKISQTSIYSGKIPPPEMMEGYNKVDQTFANRILTMAEKESEHSRYIERKKLRIATILSIFGIIAGLLALSTLCYLLFLAISNGNNVVSLGIIGIIATVTSIFVLNRKVSQKEKDN